MRSINRRLLALLIGGYLTIAILACAAVYFTALDELDEVFDYQLVQVARAFSRHGNAPLPSSISREDEAQLIVQVWSGKRLTYANPTGANISQQAVGFHTVFSGAHKWRVFVLRNAVRTIQVAQPISARREIGFSFALRAIIPLLLAIPLFALFVWLSVRYGLSPLNRIAEEVKLRTPSELKTFSLDGIPSEILPLVTQLNFFLERLSAALETQKRFVADAAHELRTPLAALALQLRVLERSSSQEERVESISSLKNGISRAAHLVSQLLALARLEPQSPREFTELRLDEAAREIVAERARIAEQHGVDLGVSESEAITIMGEIESIRALIANLVDNAVRYTQPGGIVDVAVRHGESGALIEVIDSGPGIPPEEREHVFERFYRCPGSGPVGSGLGLAIVKSALERHGGNITLTDGPEGRGLRVVVEIPCSLAPPREISRKDFPSQAPGGNPTNS